MNAITSYSPNLFFQNLPTCPAVPAMQAVQTAAERVFSDRSATLGFSKHNPFAQNLSAQVCPLSDSPKEAPQLPKSASQPQAKKQAEEKGGAFALVPSDARPSFELSSEEVRSLQEFIGKNPLPQELMRSPLRNIHSLKIEEGNTYSFSLTPEQTQAFRAFLEDLLEKPGSRERFVFYKNMFHALFERMADEYGMPKGEALQSHVPTGKRENYQQIRSESDDLNRRFEAMFGTGAKELPDPSWYDSISITPYLMSSASKAKDGIVWLATDVALPVLGSSLYKAGEITYDLSRWIFSQRYRGYSTKLPGPSFDTVAQVAKAFAQTQVQSTMQATDRLIESAKNLFNSNELKK